MDQKRDRLYPSAALEKDHLEQRLEKKLNDANSFNYHISNKKEMITYLKTKSTNRKRYIKNTKK